MCRERPFAALPLCGSVNGMRTLCAGFQASAAARPDAIALQDSDGRLRLTWADAAAEVERYAGALASLGVRRGDTVALLLTNRPEFNLIDAAAVHLGATPWSIYATSAPEQIRDLVQGAGSSLLITEAKFADRLDGLGVRVQRIEEPWPQAPEGFDFEAAWTRVEPDDVLTLIWTSGTTGTPKGVELTHAGMLSALDGIEQVARPTLPGRMTSYLPAAHVADRWSAHYWWMSAGNELTTIADAQQVLPALPRVRPTIWGSVPRVFEKLRAALEAQGVTEPAAMAEEERAAIRVKLGLDAAEFLIVGAAPLAVEAHEYFEALGLPLCEVWGMSETCGLLTVTPPERRKVGSVGPPLPEVRLEIAADGEVLARGPMLMRAYRGQPELTAETIDAEGWIHTGDIGVLDEDGYLKIVDRKKELIINAAGKNMSPLGIEAALKNAGPLIGQACVIGDRRPYNVALLLLDPDGAAAWAADHDGASDYASLARDPDMLEAVANEVEAANARLSRVEQIKRWAVLDADWLPDGDELTPTMKLKRKAIAAKHAAAIEELYA